MKRSKPQTRLDNLLFRKYGHFVHMFTVQGHCLYIAGKDIGRDCSYDIEINAEKFRDLLKKTEKAVDNPFEDKFLAVVN